MVAPKLKKRLLALQHVPLQAFCQNVRRHDFKPRFAQPNACSINQYEFLKLVVFFTYRRENDRRADALLKQESAMALPGTDQGLIWSESDEAANRMPWSGVAEDVIKDDPSATKHLAGLLEIHGAIQDAIYNLSNADVNRVSGMRPDAAKTFIDGMIEKREQEYSPLNKTFKPDRLKVENLIMKDYMGLFTQPVDYKGVFLCDELVKLMGRSLRGWRLVRYLGGGVSGKVFQMQSPDGRLVAVKFMIEATPGEAADEVRAQGVFHGFGLAPRVLEHKTITTQAGVKMHLIVMERIDFTLEEMLCVAKHNVATIRKIAGEVVNLMARMRTARVTHGDMHTQNIGYVVRDGKYVPILIDFGQSSTRSNYPLVDAEQLLRILTYRGMGMYPYSYIIAEELQKYLERIGETHKLTGDDRIQEQIWNDYMRNHRDVLSDKRRMLLQVVSEIASKAPRKRSPRKRKSTTQKRKSPRKRKSQKRKSARKLRRKTTDLFSQLL